MWEERCTDIIVKDVCDLAEETKYKGTGGKASERARRCQQLPVRSIRAHGALPGIDTARFSQLQEIVWLISEKGYTFTEKSEGREQVYKMIRVIKNLTPGKVH